MKRTIDYQIPKHADGCSVRQYLTAHGYSHAVLVQLKKTPQSILVNDIWYYVNDILHEGDKLVITLEETDSSKQIVPEAMALDILYEDEDILVINKPAGMPIHPSLNHYEHTLANGVMHYFSAQNIPYVFRCVNRLDRDTTGLTILAKHSLSSAVLSKAIVAREIHRTYLAIVEGITPACGTIDAPIARKDDSAIERIIDAQGERAVTHYRQIACKHTAGKAGLSLVALRLETGRTHQIRVHMKHLGHPLIGDFLYHPDNHQMTRQALHSFCLSFLHPITGEPVCYHAPLPADMQELFPDIDTTQLLAAIQMPF